MTEAVIPSTTGSPMKRFSLAGKSVLVTGASSGIGAHLARVASQAGGDALAVALDVMDRDSVEAAFDAAEAAFGGVDVVLNNAGIGNGQRVLQVSADDWRAMLSTNLDGVWPRSQRNAWSRRSVRAASSTSPRSSACAQAPATATTARRRPVWCN